MRTLSRATAATTLFSPVATRTKEPGETGLGRTLGFVILVGGELSFRHSLGAIELTL